MEVNYTDAVLAATINVLTTMADILVIPMEPTVKQGMAALGDITGFIDMSGRNVKGSIAISFSAPVILGIAEKMLGEKPENMNQDVKDIVGELINIIAGGAKNTLFEQGIDIDLATPRLYEEAAQSIEHSGSAPVTLLELQADSGPLYMEICFEEQRVSDPALESR